MFAWLGIDWQRRDGLSNCQRGRAAERCCDENEAITWRRCQSSVALEVHSMQASARLSRPSPPRIFLSQLTILALIPARSRTRARSAGLIIYGLVRAIWRACR